MNLEHAEVIEIRKYSNNGGISKAHKSQLDGVPTGKIRDNLSIKINNEVKHYNSLKKLTVHKSKLI